MQDSDLSEKSEETSRVDLESCIAQLVSLESYPNFIDIRVWGHMATLPQPQHFRARKSHFGVFTFALISYPVDETFSNLT